MSSRPCIGCGAQTNVRHDPWGFAPDPEEEGSFPYVCGFTAEPTPGRCGETYLDGDGEERCRFEEPARGTVRFTGDLSLWPDGWVVYWDGGIIGADGKWRPDENRPPMIIPPSSPTWMELEVPMEAECGTTEIASFYLMSIDGRQMFCLARCELKAENCYPEPVE